MAMDIKALMAKRAQLSNKQNDAIFKPAEGDTTVRIVPLASNPDNPFTELYFHYIGKKTQLSPLSYGERDPIAEFSEGLRAGGKLSKEEWKEAMQFMPTLRTYVPVVVRGKESEGVKFWGFGKQTFQQILDVIADPDYGDISNTESGHDIRITFTPAEKSPTKFADTKLSFRPKPSKLTEDPTLLNKLLTEQPDLLTIWAKNSYDDLKKFLENYLNIGTSGPAATPPATKADDEWATPAKAAPAAAAEATVVTGGATPTTPVAENVTAEFDEIFNS